MIYNYLRACYMAQGFKRGLLGNYKWLQRQKTYATVCQRVFPGVRVSVMSLMGALSQAYLMGSETVAYEQGEGI